MPRFFSPANNEAAKQSIKMDKQKVNKISLLTVQNVKLQNKTEKKISTAKRKSRVEEIQGVEGEQGDGGDSRKRWRKRQKWRFNE